MLKRVKTLRKQRQTEQTAEKHIRKCSRRYIDDMPVINVMCKYANRRGTHLTYCDNPKRPKQGFWIFKSDMCCEEWCSYKETPPRPSRPPANRPHKR